MSTNMLQGMPAALVVSAMAVLGSGCALSDEHVNPTDGETTVDVSSTESDGAVGSVAQREERRYCFINRAGRRVCRERGGGGTPPPDYEEEVEEDVPDPTVSSNPCEFAPDTTACGRSAGLGGNRDTLYTCRNGVVLGKEYCPSGCQHRPRGLTDYCI